VLKEADQIFEQNLERAKQLLTDNLYDGAKFHIEKARQVNGQSPEALQVQVEIEKLPDLLPLLNGVAIARAENDIQKEYDYLQQVSKIAPERDGVKDRLNELRDRINTQKFEWHISSGFDNCENKQPQKARSHYKKARQIDSKRPELSWLLTQILALEKSLRIKLAVNQAQQAVRQDDWEQVKLNFTRAAKDAPEDQKVVEGLRRANHILSLQAGLEQFLKSPYRLAHKAVLNKAQQTLVAANAASGDSFTIKRQAIQLGELITQINRVIPVTIISDNQTYVLVRGVGKVGVVTKKIIQLKPGNYTFEGTRKGFKSKLLHLLIPYDQNQFSVRVICDESI
jgi:tetratricopeptide (TPR) repeat protein